MTATMKNIALAPLDDSRGAGRWATSDPWCLVPKLHRKSMTSNLFLELTVHFQTGRRSFAEWEHAGEPPGRTISRQFGQTQAAGSACLRHDGTRTPRSAHLPQAVLPAGPNRRRRSVENDEYASFIGILHAYARQVADR